MANAPHWEAIRTCTRATVGDAAIMLASYWLVTATAHTRWWVLKPRAAQLVGFTAAGVIITIVIEHFAVRSTDADWGWRYATMMPTVPVIGTGLAPPVQWTLLPPVTTWFVMRQLGHIGRPSGAHDQ